jgi:hypothetical protein
MAVLAGSLLAAFIGASILMWRDRFYRSVYERRTAAVQERAASDGAADRGGANKGSDKGAER